MIKMSILSTSPHLRTNIANIVIIPIILLLFSKYLAIVILIIITTIPIIMLLKVSIVNLLTTVLNDAPILPEEEAEGTGSIIR